MIRGSLTPEANDAMAVLGLLVVAALIGGGVGWTAYLVRVGMLDARDLAEKTAFRRPRSALEWPELRVDGVVAQPDEELVLVQVGWPARPSEASLLLLRLEAVGETGRLVKWCETRAPITTSATMGRSVEFRRRRTLERIQALVIGESPG
jgi:hypothetical protein